MFFRLFNVLKFSFFATLCSSSFANEGGIIFQCENVSEVIKKVDTYLRNNNVKSDEYDKNIFPNNKVQYILKDKNISTIEIKDKFEIKPEKISLPFPKETKHYEVVSKKEIVLSLMHNGKTNKYSGDFCNFETFVDSIGVRQNTSAWGVDLDFTWFNGKEDEWNQNYWIKDTTEVRNTNKIVEAINDAFMYQNDYAIGCLSAARLLMAQGILDYYSRVSPNKKILSSIINDLNKNGFTLIEVDPDGKTNKGKLLAMEENVSAKNIIPGDWLYFKNTDEESSNQPGYEGSNTIYLGIDNFVDFFNSNNHHYTLKEKFNHVYQWRNGVFDETTDADKIKPISPELYKQLEETPANGGIVQDYRLSHYLYAENKNGEIVKKAIFE